MQALTGAIALSPAQMVEASMERSRQVHRQRQLEALLGVVLGARWHASCAEGLLRWHRAVTADASRTAARSLAELRVAHDASMVAGRRALEGRRADAIRRAIAIKGGVGVLLGLGGAWSRWVRFVVASPSMQALTTALSALRRSLAQHASAHHGAGSVPHRCASSWPRGGRWTGTTRTRYGCA